MKQMKHMYFSTCAIPENEKALSMLDFIAIRRHLPDPDTTEIIGNTKYSVYRAKSFSRPTWKHPLLKRLVVEARKTYHEYYGSDIPLLDRYDAKSAIYLVQVTYITPIKKTVLIENEKWYSIRFVPALGNPDSTEDLDYYLYEQDKTTVPILSLMREKLPALQKVSETMCKKSIVTISRFCSIPAYVTDKSYRKIYETYIAHLPHHKRTYHAVISMALANQHVLQNNTFTIFTAQMHDMLSNTILSFPPYSGKKRLPFISAHTILGVPKHTIRLDRKQKYVYKYPAYFLDHGTLIDALKKLIVNKQVSQDYVSKFFVLKKRNQQYHMIDFAQLGKLCSTQGTVPHSLLTGNELRQYFNKEVKDGPELRIMPIDIWKRGIESMIKYARKSV